MSALGNGLAGLVESLSGGVETRLQRLRAAVRAEVRRAASALALAIVAAAMVIATLVFGAVAILIAAWDSHPVLAAALIALGFAILAVAAVVKMQSSTR